MWLTFLALRIKSLEEPFTIMFSVPMRLIGVFWALDLTGTTLSTTSFMGIIMMVGIVASNGLIPTLYTMLEEWFPRAAPEA